MEKIKEIIDRYNVKDIERYCEPIGIRHDFGCVDYDIAKEDIKFLINMALRFRKAGLNHLNSCHKSFCTCISCAILKVEGLKSLDELDNYYTEESKKSGWIKSE